MLVETLVAIAQTWFLVMSLAPWVVAYLFWKFG